MHAGARREYAPSVSCRACGKPGLCSSSRNTCAIHGARATRHRSLPRTRSGGVRVCSSRIKSGTGSANTVAKRYPGPGAFELHDAAQKALGFGLRRSGEKENLIGYSLGATHSGRGRRAGGRGATTVNSPSMIDGSAARGARRENHRRTTSTSAAVASANAPSTSPVATNAASTMAAPTTANARNSGWRGRGG